MTKTITLPPGPGRSLRERVEYLEFREERLTAAVGTLIAFLQVELGQQVAGLIMDALYHDNPATRIRRPDREGVPGEGLARVQEKPEGPGDTGSPQGASVD